MATFDCSRSLSVAAALLLLVVRHATGQVPPPPAEPDLSELAGPVVHVVPNPGLDSTNVYTYVEQMPALPTKGMSQTLSVAQRVQQLLRVPAEVRTGKVAGTVLVSFTVGPSGAVRDVRVLKSLSPACDAAARAAVAQLPRLVAGRQNGIPVSVSLQAPVLFTVPGK